MWQSALAVLSLLPTALQLFRRGATRDHWFWTSLLVGLAGASAWAAGHSTGTWRMGLSETLWVMAAVTLLTFAGTALLLREAWRLAGLLGSYLILVTLLAVLWQSHAPAAAPAAAHSAWINAHIITALITYALVTLAAVAAVAAFLQGTALKRRWRTRVAVILPSLADCDTLQVRLLQWGEAVLAAGLLTGMALEYVQTGHLLEVSHKIVFTLAAFLVIAGLLIAHHSRGVRGRQAARVVLLSYLLLTLGFPGVKFVTDILISGADRLAGAFG